MSMARRPPQAMTVMTIPDSVPVVGFTGSYRWLSNFYVWPFRVVLSGGDDDNWSISATADTLEHAYQASKATTVGDMQRILHAPTARDARRIGRSIAARADWAAVRVPTMRALVYLKFADVAEGVRVLLADRLLATGSRELVEANTWGDRFWGATPAVSWTEADTLPALKVPDGEGFRVYVGENWLGRILMERRSAIAAARGGRRGR